MKLKLSKIEDPFVFELINETGITTKIDASEVIGGKGKGFRPMELLAGSLAGCMSIDVMNILRKQRLKVDYFEIEINAKRREEIPQTFMSIELIINVKECDLNDKLKKAVQLSISKYCSVAHSLKSDVVLTYRIINK